MSKEQKSELMVAMTTPDKHVNMSLEKYLEKPENDLLAGRSYF